MLDLAWNKFKLIITAWGSKINNPKSNTEQQGVRCRHKQLELCTGTGQTGSTRIKQTPSKKVENEEAKVRPDPDWDIRGQSAGHGGEETEKSSGDI